MNKEEIKDILEDYLEQAESDNTGVNESQLDYREKVSDFIINLIAEHEFNMNLCTKLNKECVERNKELDLERNKILGAWEKQEKEITQLKEQLKAKEEENEFMKSRLTKEDNDQVDFYMANKL
jgi:hypothetical protein